MFVSCLCETVSAQPIGENTTPVFKHSHQIATDSGYTQLNWSLPEIDLKETTVEFELQQSESPDFSTPKTIYTGPDTASFISGLPNGVYYYRVRIIGFNNEPGIWSEQIELTVQHHSLQLALSLFAIGFIVFIATVYVVVTGTNKADV